MNTGNNNPRMRGVQHAATRQPDRGGPPRTIVHIEKAEQYGVAFYDEQGRLQHGIVIRFGDQLLWPPNSVEWASQLKKASKWFVDAFEQRVGHASQEEGHADLPTTDNVDVLGGGNGKPSNQTP